MKEFVNKHARLYWFIVVTLAVLAFSIVTAVGCAKLERAEASTGTYTVAWGTGEKTFTLDKYPYYMYFVCSDKDRTVYYLALCEDVITFKKDNTCLGSEGVGVLYYYTDFVNPAISDNELTANFGDRSLVGVMNINGEVFCNFDVLNYYNREQVLYTVNPLFAGNVYSVTAPYVKFSKLYEDAPLRGRVFNAFQYLCQSPNYKNNPNAQSYWKYYGNVCNLIDSGNSEGLLLEVSFNVELPTYEYLTDFMESNALKYDEIEAGSYDGCVKSGVAKYDSDKSIERELYRFTYIPELMLESDGSFSYVLTYEEILNYLFYFNEDLREKYIGDSNLALRNYLMAFARVESTSSIVFVEGVTQTVYGRSVIDYYTRGRSDAVSAEIMVDVFNATSDELEKAIADALSKGYDDALGNSQNTIEDLQNRIDSLESTLNTQNGFLDGFDNVFDGNALWGAIRSVGSGLIGISGFLVSFATVIGSFFGFLPYDMQQIVGYLVIASLAVILWRLLKK